VTFCTFKTRSIKGTCLEREYLLFLYLKYHCKKLNFKIIKLKHVRIKNSYYHNFKTQFKGWSRANPESLVEAWVTSRVDLSQCKNKSAYYYSFKIQFEGQPRTRPELLAGWLLTRVNVRTKFIINIVLELDSMVDLG
jgi:hypothetical protein